MTTNDQPLSLTVADTLEPDLRAAGQTVRLQFTRGQFTITEHMTRGEAHALGSALSRYLAPYLSREPAPAHDHGESCRPNAHGHHKGWCAPDCPTCYPTTTQENTMHPDSDQDTPTEVPTMRLRNSVTTDPVESTTGSLAETMRALRRAGVPGDAVITTESRGRGKVTITAHWTTQHPLED